MSKLLDELERIDQSAHELWSDYQVRLAIRALPALIRVARVAGRRLYLDSLVSAEEWQYELVDGELEEALQQLRSAGTDDKGARALTTPRVPAEPLPTAD